MAVKPDWLRVKAPQWERVGNVKEVLRDLGLNTVCEEASCPNIGECFNQGTATFLIMGQLVLVLVLTAILTLRKNLKLSIRWSQLIWVKQYDG